MSNPDRKDEPSSDALGTDALQGGAMLREVKLGEQLHKYLTDLIESGKLANGAKLPTEKQFCERFRISRPVVREALARLRMEGLITSRRGSGSYVIGGPHAAPVEPPRRAPMVSLGPAPVAVPHGSAKLTTLLRCFEVRIAMECDAAYYAAQRRSDEHLRGMEAAIVEMENALQTHSLDHEAHFKFHMLIAEAADNPFMVASLCQIEQHMEALMNLLRNLWVIDPDQPISAGEYRHHDIFVAIRDQQPEAAGEAMYLHLTEAMQEIFGDLAAPIPRCVGQFTQ